MKMLFESQGIQTDWKYGDTFAKYTISNREYELANYIEFAAKVDNTIIGFRYTPYTYDLEHFKNLGQDFTYLSYHEAIPGFDNLGVIDELISINWSGIEDDDLEKKFCYPEGDIRKSISISLHSFFMRFFSEEIYNLFIKFTSDAVSQAQEIIALKAVPQLLPNNILTFKDTVIELFSDEMLENMQYDFWRKDHGNESLSQKDMSIIKQTFIDGNYKMSIIGSEDFAKSFITSEYLFQTMHGGLGIDYTAVVSGYFKSVEQLLYLYYISAFKGEKGLQYWDKCNKTEYFDSSQVEKYRYDPYNEDKRWKQEKYYHPIKTGKNAPSIGKLVLFLRYNDETWILSESGKEYLHQCLDDYCKNCRNLHFHKDNIYSDQYEDIKRIRNNTIVCLYFILGGFKLLDCRINMEQQLGIENYEFERIVESIWSRRNRWFWINIPNIYEGVAIYKDMSMPIKYDELGKLVNLKIRFVKFPEASLQSAEMYRMEEKMHDSAYISANNIEINRNTEIAEIRPFLPKKDREYIIRKKD